MFFPLTYGTFLAEIGREFGLLKHPEVPVSQEGRIMNKSDLVASIAKAANISKMAAERGLNSMLNTMAEAMEDGERVTLVGFGSFAVVDRAPRLGRNPKTGEKVAIPPRRGVKFRPGKDLARKLQ